MVHISADAVNLRSPYKVKQEGDNVFLFRTRYGIAYSVGFIPDTSFMREGLYQFFIINESGKTSRDRLFKIWFHTYIMNDAYSMYSEQMTIDNVRYFSSIILRKDHPMHNAVLSKYHDFIVEHSQR